MSQTYIPAELRRQTNERGDGRCEYCLIPESAVFATHEIDHIVAEKHGGQTEEQNLALCCAVCNKYKGSDLTSIDPGSGAIVPLFHPRRDTWNEHFALIDGRIESRSPIGRVTVRLLHFNHPDRIDERKLLLDAGLLKPPAT